jgi:predicted lipoprotein with Yx(FWY)xxD motif
METIMRIPTLVPLMLLASASLAFAEPPVTTVKTEKGEVIAGAKGMTLYTFKNDKKGMSNCYDGCAKAWPPFIAKSGAKGDDDYSLVLRKDGTMQWAYYGKPLYYWMKDKKEGDVTGDGFKGVWDAARPE